MDKSVDTFNGPPHEISNLEVLGGYSIDGDGQYRNDLSQLMYYKKPRKCKIDLHKDVDKTIEKLPKAKLDFLLKWILQNLSILKVDDSQNLTRWLNIEFICLRGVLKQLLYTPFERDDWIICASKFKGTIYLLNYDTEEKMMQVNVNPYVKNCCIWGRKFEQYLLAKRPHENPDLSVPLNENEEFCCMFKANFGATRLLYGAEMDGIYSQEIIQDTIAGKQLKFIEIKTLHIGRFKINKLNDDGKKLLWWSQVYPVGIKTIVCGLRDHKGIVKDVKELNTDQLTSDVKAKKDISKRFCSGFLEYIKNIVVKEHDLCMYKFTYHAKQRLVRVEEIDSNTEYTFLHSWYTNAINEHISNFK